MKFTTPIQRIFRRADMATLRLLARAGRWLRSGQGNGGSSRGVVLVITLWIIIVLGVIASSLAFDVQVGSKLTLLQKEEFVAYNLAKSAVAVGITHLQNDMIIDYVENPNQAFDAFSDVWAMRDQREKEKVVEVDPKNYPDRTYELEIVDEESKIPLNQANFKIMKAMMEYYGFEAPDSDDIAYAIVDYRDQDDMAGGEPGAYENEYYSGELGQRVDPDTPADQLLYRCPNEQFLTTDQLLDVYGFNQFPEIYYGYKPEERAEKELELRDAVAAGKRVRAKRERKRGRDRDPLPIKDIVTVTVGGQSQGRVNMNTASLEVLTILIHAATDFTSIESAKATAESIVDYRGDDDNRAPDPDKAFKSSKDLAQVPGVDMNAINQLGSLGIQATYSSNTFRIIGTGKTTKAHRVVEAVVERKLETYNPDDASLASNKGRGSGRRSGGSSRGSGSGGEGGGSRSGGSGGNRGGTATDDYIRIPAVRVVQWID